MARRKEPRIPDAVLDGLLAGADPKPAFDPDGLLDALKKALAARAPNAEMDLLIRTVGIAAQLQQQGGRVVTVSGNDTPTACQAKTGQRAPNQKNACWLRHGILSCRKVGAY